MDENAGTEPPDRADVSRAGAATAAVTAATTARADTTTTAEVDVTGVAAGGDGVGRLPDGRVVFVRGALPGDRVAVAVDEERARFARGRAVTVLEAGPGRVEPGCPMVARGCGGCGWQHVEHATQRRLKERIVTDALVRIGRLAPAAIPEVDPGPELPPTRYRTTVRAAVDPDTGRASFRVHHGHALVPVDPAVGCLVAHPLVDEVLRTRTFAGPTVAVRAGAATGEVLVVSPGERGRYHEVVDGHRFRISAPSFFQVRPDGAAALAAAAREAVVAAGDPPGRLADLYAGVGLFAALVPGGRVVAVESSASAVADLKANVPGARAVRADVRRWTPSPADAVVADPSRHGLGREVVERIAATGAADVVLVSCDAGALGRDAGLLAAAGYGLRAVTLVDLFPQTPHVEVVTSWRRRPSP